MSGQRAILVVDHGSRRAEANATLFQFLDVLRRQAPAEMIIHGAHMEMSSPDIREGFANCVRDGAEHVIVVPYFLAPGKHCVSDIPAMAAEAASVHAGITYSVSKPLGVHEKIGEVVLERALAGSRGNADD